MSVTHSPALRNAHSTLVLNTIDQDAAAGSLVFQTSADAEVATCTLAYPAGVVTGASLAFSTITQDPSATGGVISKFKITDNSGDQVLAGAVGLSGSDINMSSLTILAGESVAVTALSYTAPV